MSELQHDVCKHGVTFYPGRAEREQCCTYCAREHESGPTKLPIEPEKCSAPTVDTMMQAARRNVGRAFIREFVNTTEYQEKGLN
jgi:hypothetical protein